MTNSSIDIASLVNENSAIFNRYVEQHHAVAVALAYEDHVVDTDGSDDEIRAAIDATVRAEDLRSATRREMERTIGGADFLFEHAEQIVRERIAAGKRS